MNIIKAYFDMDYKGRQMVKARITLTISFIMGIYKLFLAFQGGLVFVAAGGVDILIAFAKILTLVAISKRIKVNNKLNIIIATLELCAGIEYTAIMIVLLNISSGFNISRTMAYIVSTLSIIQFIYSVYGLFRVSNKGHYFRTIKLLDFTIAMTSLSLTIRAIIYQDKHDIYISEILGIVIGIVILIIGIGTLLATWFSIFDSL